MPFEEVAQQSKARRKDDFLIAFSPVIAEATATAYKGATNEVQQKLRRVVEVWRQRQIFEVPIQDAIEARIDGMVTLDPFTHIVSTNVGIELDKSRSSGKRPAGSLFSSNAAGGVPAEFAPLVEPQQTITKLVLSTKTSVNAANQDYEKLSDPSAVVPSAPVHAARLNGLLKTLANAEGAVAESIKARKILISALEKILDSNRTSLSEEEHLLTQLAGRRAEIDQKKRDVEESIMRGFASSGSPSGSATASDGSPAAGQTPGTPPSELDRPEIEALTPPGYPQSPTVDPIPELAIGTSNGSTAESVPAPAPALAPTDAGSDLLSSLATSSSYGAYGQPTSAENGNTTKKRKLNLAHEFPDFGGGDAMDGLDADVAEMLRQDDASGA